MQASDYLKAKNLNDDGEEIKVSRTMILELNKSRRYLEL